MFLLYFITKSTIKISHTYHLSLVSLILSYSHSMQAYFNTYLEHKHKLFIVRLFQVFQYTNVCLSISTTGVALSFVWSTWSFHFSWLLTRTLSSLPDFVSSSLILSPDLRFIVIVVPPSIDCPISMNLHLSLLNSICQVLDQSTRQFKYFCNYLVRSKRS